MKLVLIALRMIALAICLSVIAGHLGQAWLGDLSQVLFLGGAADLVVAFALAAHRSLRDAQEERLDCLDAIAASRWRARCRDHGLELAPAPESLLATRALPVEEMTWQADEGGVMHVVGVMSRGPGSLPAWLVQPGMEQAARMVMIASGAKARVLPPRPPEPSVTDRHGLGWWLAAVFMSPVGHMPECDCSECD